MSEQQKSLYGGEETTSAKRGPVTCLGMVFESDEARRAYFTEKLQEKLQDPAFRAIEGFPIGEDEDILALSDPPYYTACPNPWLTDFILEWKDQKPPHPEGYRYHREPFAVDVSEGRNDSVYNAHRYPTKVPPKAIMRFILHYTNPGDIVLDGFCGTGMVGVAVNRCSNPDKATKSSLEANQNNIEWGERRYVLSDLSPIATFISNNQTSSPDIRRFQRTLTSVISNVKKEFGWIYESIYPNTKKTTQLYHMVWSEVYNCPSCSNDVVFWEAAVDKNTGVIAKEFECSHCGALLAKQQLERKQESVFHEATGEVHNQSVFIPVASRFLVRGDKADYPIQENDLETIKKILATKIPFWHPSESIKRDIDMWYERDYTSLGIFNLDSFYTKRNLLCFAALWNESQKIEDLVTRNSVLFTLTGMAVNLSRMNCWRHEVSFPYNPISGTLYVSSLSVESNVFHGVTNKGKRLASIWRETNSKKNHRCISTQATQQLQHIPNDSIDYIFTDPPFGSNFIYSDLSLLYEAWLKISTSTRQEAVVHRRKKEGNRLEDYRKFMTDCFREYHRVLKPGRWMTVVFSNTKASVWNSIQTALTEAGFIVANVSALDKKQGSFKALTTPTAVKQDLVISAYKPNRGFEERFQHESKNQEGVWDFVRTHLNYLSVTKLQAGRLLFIPERDPRILFDQMIAYYVRKGFPVPLSSQEFQMGLAQRFIERDGMFFLPDQAEEYERKKLLSGEAVQASIFVTDESSAIQWLRQLLKDKPQTFSDINPQFMQQLGGWSKNEAQLDLRELLNQNFLSYDGKGPVPEQIHAYLSTNWRDMRNLPKDDPDLMGKAQDRWYVPDPNKAGDLERLKERALLKEFEGYKQVKRKLKSTDRVRSEALRAGFKYAWQEKDYATIVAMGDKIPSNVLEEDTKLLMWYDQAVTRMGGDG